MNKEKYPVTFNNVNFWYEFISEGPKGTIRKIIQFQKFDHRLFNLSFGDWNESLQKIDHFVRSNNNDREKVLATVAFAVLEFLEHHPGVYVIASGNTPARTRLYQKTIVANHPEIIKTVKLEGYINDDWQVFTKNTNYSAFLVKIK